jgi:hypothetical protein
MPTAPACSVVEVKVGAGPEAATVSVVEPVTPLCVAEIVVVPPDTPVASPVALIVATAVFEEAHVAVAVRTCVELSLNVPIAVNCSVSATNTAEFAGVTAIDTSTGAVTVSCAVPEMLPDVAVIVTGPPAFTPVARPAALIVAIVVLLELHVAVLVRF